MIVSFINIPKDPRGVLKTSGFALGFQHFARDLANVNEWKTCLIPLFNQSGPQIFQWFKIVNKIKLYSVSIYVKPSEQRFP